MKYLGAIFIWTSLTVTGINFSAKYKKRCALFKDIIFLIENISGEINYLSRPLKEIIYEINSNNCSANLSFISLCNGFLLSGEDFPIAWKKSIDKSDLPLKNEEKVRLIALGQNIGKTDSESQKGVLNFYLTIFNSFSIKAEKEREKYYTTTLVGCFLCGCALFILVL